MTGPGLLGPCHVVSPMTGPGFLTPYVVSVLTGRGLLMFISPGPVIGQTRNMALEVQVLS
jgi:hypothetical protein